MSDKKVGVLKRIAEATSYLISGVGPDNWFGPNQPVQPLAQESMGRQADYPVGYNQQQQPRAYEAVKFTDLRALADNCDILRTVIESRKDQLAKLKFSFKLKKDKENTKDSRCEELENFMACPDGIHTWDEFYRALLEDLFVIDAPCILPEFSNGGKLLSLQLMDGATITKKIDQYGRTPTDNTSPAYQQVLKGVPANNLTYRELIYKPRNVRSNKVYGYSPVEQIINTINTQIRKTVDQLSYYKEGNYPDLLLSAPEAWNSDQITKFQQYWDELNMGQSKKQSVFMPGGIVPFNTKPEPLKNEFDEWLASIICYAFSVSSQPFKAHMNRATAETAKNTADEEGLLPIMTWTKNLMDYIIIQYFGYRDIEFHWDVEKETDPLVKAQIEQIYVSCGVKTVNEVRKELALDPLPEPVVVASNVTQNEPKQKEEVQ